MARGSCSPARITWAYGAPATGPAPDWRTQAPRPATLTRRPGHQPRSAGAACVASAMHAASLRIIMHANHLSRQRLRTYATGNTSRRDQPRKQNAHPYADTLAR